MAKGEVIEHLGDGQYRVSLKFGIERIQRELTELNERIAELAVLVPEAKTELLQAEAAAKAKAAEIDDAIPDYQNGVEGALQIITALQVELVKLQGEAQIARLKADQLISENLSLLKRRAQLERLPEEETRDIWCADYVTDVSGEVGLIEVNDEGSDAVIMQPAFNDEGGYLAARDGELVPRGAQSGIQVYFNAAILPGVQKWLPRYRIGTLTAIDGGLANVTLDEATSSAQNLDINLAGILKEVPIQYMDCDATAFEVGDRVLVRWFDSGPQVVGFESNPKPCFGHGLVFCPSQARLDGSRAFWGQPFEDGTGAEINPPLGSSLGSNPVWSIQKRREDSPIKSAKGLEYNYGLRNWIGINSTRDILSWRGPASRVFDWYNNFGETDSTLIPNFQIRWRRSSEVFYKLTVLVDLTDYTLGGFTKVCGASMYYEGETAFLLVVATDADEWSPGPDYRVYEWELNRQFEATGSPTLKQSFTVDPDIYPLTDWYFDGSGKRAVCTLRNQKLEETDPADYSIIYKAEYSLAGGFSIASVWDATTLPANRTIQSGEFFYKQIRRETISGGCGAPKLGISAQDVANLVNNRTEPAESIPLYFDYRELDQVAAYYQKPQLYVNNGDERSATKTTKDYPHPCAGQPKPGGGTYPADLRVESTNRTDALGDSSATYSAPFRIVDNNGAVICESKITPSEATQKGVIIETEYVQWSEACGSILIDEKFYSLTYSRTVNMVNFGLIAIDVRTNFAATVETITELASSGSKTGVDYTAEAETNAQGTYEWHDVAVSETANNLGTEMRVFLGGNLLEETQIEYEDFLDGSQRFERFDEDDYFVNQQIFFLPECDDEKTVSTVQTTVEPRKPLPNFVASHTGDGTCVQADELTAISASCFPNAPLSGNIGLFTYVSGVTDPIAEIIQRDEADKYVFHFLGLY